MRLSPLHLAGAVTVLGAVLVAYVVRPAALNPHPVASPSLELPPIPEHAGREAARAAATPGGATVYVAGAVAHPGVYTLRAGARVNDAVIRAGGANRDADPIAVNFAAPLVDGQEIAVPRIGETLPLASAATGDDDAPPRRKHRRSSHPARRRHRAPRDRSDAYAGRRDDGSSSEASETEADRRFRPIDLNTASVETLSTLPGVGETMAERIVAFRQLNGPFDTVDGLADVSGMTERRVETLEPLVTVSR
jgi:competence protein ComEA